MKVKLDKSYNDGGTTFRYGFRYASTGEIVASAWDRWNTKRGAENYAKRNCWEIVDDASEAETTKTNQTVKLQGIGERPAIKASDLKPGMVMVCNYGYKYEIIDATISKTGKTVTVTSRNIENGKECSRRHGAETLVAVEIEGGEPDGIATKYGTITESREDFGYGQVWAEYGEIVYQDMGGYKSWKTVRGFERWADKQNAISGGVYQAIGASNEPTYEEDAESVSREDITLAVIDQVVSLVKDCPAIKSDTDSAVKTFCSGVFRDWVNNRISATFTKMAWGTGEDDLTTKEQEDMFWVVYLNVIENSSMEEAGEPQATEEGTTVNRNVVTTIEDGRVFEYRIERAASGNWFEYMYIDGEYCGDWTGKRCIYGVKTDAPWIRDPYRLGGKIHLTPEMIQALRNAQAAA